jgi:hypothetical protein
MTINLSANSPRVSYAVSEGATTTSFTVSFEFFAAADLNVYVDGTAKVLGSGSGQYAVTGGNGSTGAVSLSVTGATGGSTVVVTRDIDLERTTDFPSSGSFQIATLNTELDRFVAIAADLKDSADRALQLTDFDAAVSLVLPDVDTRKGKVLAFNASTGAVEAGPSTADVQTVSANAASVAILGTSAAVADMVILGTDAIVADMAILGTSAVVADMAILATDAIVADLAILATDAIVADMAILGTTDVVADMAILATDAIVADMAILATDAIVADMAILGTTDVVADMAILATSDVVTDMNVLATSDIVTDMNLLATSAVIEDMGLLATSAVIEDMGLLAVSAVITDMSILGTADIVADMAILGTAAIVEDMGILGTSANVTAMSNVSGSIANVNTVASNLTNVNSFANTYHGAASSDPTSSLSTGDLYFSTSVAAMKVYNGTSWIVATSSGNTSLLSYEYLATSGQTTFSGSDTNSATLAYTVNNIIVSLNGVILDGGGNSDYTASNGTSVVLGVGASAGDILSVVAFKSFTTADMVPASSGGTFAGDITVATSDGAILNLNSNDTTITDGSVLGAIKFTAPLEGSGTDAILVGASIEAVAEGTFAADNNATELVFKTGASAAADAKMIINSAGNVGIGGNSTGNGLGVYLSKGTGANFFEASDGTKTMITGTDSAQDFVKIGSLSAHPVGFVVGNGEKMRIDAAGNLTLTDGNLIVADGHGIDFTAADSGLSSTSNLLSDYEEGGFTPVNVQAGFSQSISSFSNALYTKVGRLVHISFTITLGTAGRPTGWSSFSGLPFSASSTQAGGNYNSSALAGGGRGTNAYVGGAVVYLFAAPTTVDSTAWHVAMPYST